MRIGMLVSAILLAGAAVAPALADLRDVAAASDGETGHVWLMFDEAPGAVEAAMTGDGLQLDIAGVEVRQRVIAPYDVSMVSTISVSPTETGARILIGDEVGWNSARAEIVDGAVLVTIGLPATQVRVEGERREIGTGMPGAETGQTEADAPAPAPAPAPATRAAPGEDFAPRSQPPAPAVQAPATPGAATPDEPATASPASPASGTCAAEAAAVEADRWDDDSLHAHAACLTGAGELEDAAAIYEQMLAFAPENFRALIALAELRETQGKDAAARALYSQAAEYALSDAEAARARARLRDLRDNN